MTVERVLCMTCGKPTRPEPDRFPHRSALGYPHSLRGSVWHRTATDRLSTFPLFHRPYWLYLLKGEASMNIRVDAKALQTELSLALGIVETKATIPILSNLLIRAEGDHLELAATDLEVTLKTRCPAEVTQPGAITVPAKTFGPIVKAFAGQDAPLGHPLHAGEQAFHPARGRKAGVPPAHPSRGGLSDPPSGRPTRSSLTVPSEALRRCVQEALVSVGTDDNRYSIRGALMILEPEGLTVVSTDSHRLTFTQWSGTLDVQASRRALVPQEDTSGVPQTGERRRGEALLQRQPYLHGIGEPALYSRLMDSTFPAYERVLPSDSDKRALVNRASFLERLKRVAMVAETKTRAVTLLFSPGGTVEMVVRNQETGDEGREYLVCESYEGEAVTICFNVDFLIDFLTVCYGGAGVASA